MALHRDVFWVGRQWAVTGHGIQACDQKQKGQFDIESTQLWDDAVLESMCVLKWLNIEDFSKALSIARVRYPQPLRKAPPPEEDVSRVNGRSPKEKSPKETVSKEIPVEPPKPLAQRFVMRVERWPTKFVRQWRIRVHVGAR